MSAIDTWQDTSKSLNCLKGKGMGIDAVGRAGGLTIFVVYQDANDKFDKSEGQSAAQNAIEYASSDIGQPEGSEIYVSVDYDASPMGE